MLSLKILGRKKKITTTFLCKQISTKISMLLNGAIIFLLKYGESLLSR